MSRRNATFLAGLGLIVLTWYWVTRRPTLPAPKPTAPTAPLNREAILAPVPLPRDAFPEHAKERQVKCKEQVRQWVNFDLNPFARMGGSNTEVAIRDAEGLKLALRELVGTSLCQSFKNKELVPQYAEVFKECAPTQTLAGCLMSFLNFRMSFLDRTSENIPLSEIRDENLMAIKMIQSLSYHDEENSIRKTIERANRLLEINPDNEKGALFLVKAHMRMRDMGKGTTAEIYAAFDRVEQTIPNDLDGVAVKFHVAKARKNSQAMAAAGERLISNSHSELERSMGYYYLGWQAYEAKDVERAKGYLRQSMKEAQGNSFVIHALETLSTTPNVKQSPFIDLSGGFTLMSVSGS